MMNNNDEHNETVEMIAQMIVIGTLVIGVFYIMLNVLLHPSYMEGKRAMDAVYVGNDTFIDSDGEAWQCDGEGYKNKEQVVLVFDTQNTDTIYDDEIVVIQ